MVYGALLHQIFQAALWDNDFSTRKLDGEIEKAILRAIEDLYCIGENERGAMEALREVVPLYQSWAMKFIGENPKSEAIVKEKIRAGHGPVNATPPTTLCIKGIVDIEDQFWSPQYGLKGNVDATVEIEYGRPSNTPMVSAGAGGRSSSYSAAAFAPTFPSFASGVDRSGSKVASMSTANTTALVPFELKTSKHSNNSSHRAQTILYTLLMGDRFDKEVSSGLLYYAKTGETFHIETVRDEIRSLICLEKGTSVSSGLGSLFDQKTGHLTDAHVAFFEHWDRLITLEEGDMQRYRREIWCLSSEEREKLGRCFAHMKLVSVEQAQNEKGVNSYLCRFERKQSPQSTSLSQAHNCIQPPKPSSSSASANAGSTTLLSSRIGVGDPVVVSEEGTGNYALAIGFVVDLQPNFMVISTDRKPKASLVSMAEIRDGGATICPSSMSSNVRLSQDPENPLQSKSARRQFGQRSRHSSVTFQLGSQSQRQEDGSDEGGNDSATVLWRIDKDELTSGMALTRHNLISLFTEDGDRKRRRLIVDLEAPIFQPDLSSQLRVAIGDDEKLNPDQRNAVEKVLTAQDYALVLGMPGTGKTTTIAFIIRALVKQGKSVFLTSYTHTAVDNVLLKLIEFGVDFLRLGNAQKVHPHIYPYTTQYQRDKLKTVEDMAAFYESKMVVATTCLGIKQYFDYCIVDEASQLTLPVCLGPLRYADRFVLVGDHYQLPPLAVVQLEHQYRMNADIMLLSNTLIYNNRLRCGTPEVAESMLNVPVLQGLEAIHDTSFASQSSQMQKQKQQYRPCMAGGSECWLAALVDPRRRAVFVDTDNVPAHDTRTGDLVQNEIEAVLVHQIVEALLECGVDQSDIGVISPYRSQLKILNHGLKRYSSIEVHTVDKYQGRDKPCIIVSLVRSNTKLNVGDLLRDWRRINVAFTRAKRKLIILGSKSTLEGGATLFATFLELMEKNNWPIPEIGSQCDHVRQRYYNSFCTVGADGGRTQRKPTTSKPATAKTRKTNTIDFFKPIGQTLVRIIYFRE
ncbi:Tripartite DNA replication factor [Quaeritorhiza haematococci]|nr:Tripartite DNA replication factor [Quaeritorhiza haematococci]